MIVAREISLEPDTLNVLLVLGVNGVGKTTTIAKLAHHFRSQQGRGEDPAGGGRHIPRGCHRAASAPGRSAGAPRRGAGDGRRPRRGYLRCDFQCDGARLAASDRRHRGAAAQQGRAREGARQDRQDRPGPRSPGRATRRSLSWTPRRVRTHSPRPKFFTQPSASARSCCRNAIPPRRAVWWSPSAGTWESRSPTSGSGRSWTTWSRSIRTSTWTRCSERHEASHSSRLFSCIVGLHGFSEELLYKSNDFGMLLSRIPAFMEHDSRWILKVRRTGADEERRLFDHGKEVAPVADHVEPGDDGEGGAGVHRRGPHRAARL